MNIAQSLAVCAVSAWLPVHAGTDTLQETIEEAMSAGSLLSAIMMVRDGQETRSVSLGQRSLDTKAAPDAATAYQIGSITKAFTNLLLAEMSARGMVRPTTPVSEILGSEVTFSNTQIGEITLSALATHSSGLPRLPANLGATDTRNPYAAFDEARLLEALATTRALQPLGGHYGYSNLGAGLLGYLLGRVHGGGYQTALQELIIQPLGLAQTGFEKPETHAVAFSGGQAVPAWSFDALAGAGAMWSTADDLLQLSAALLDTESWPLQQDARIQRTLVDVQADDFLLTPVWHVFDTEQGRVFWHNGGTAGHRSFFGIRPATEEALVLLLSGDMDPTAPALDWFGYAAPDRQSRQEPDELIDPAIPGQYQLSPATGIGVYEHAGTLVAQLSGQPPARLYPVIGSVYALHIADASLRFIRENDSVIAVELIQNGVVQRAERAADQAAVLARQEISLSEKELFDYVGEYQLTPMVVFTIRQGESGLEAQLTGQPFVPIFPRAQDVFFYKVVDAELHFERDDSHAVSGLVLHQGGRELPAKRMNN